MIFNTEKEFETALINLLTNSCGWEKDVLEYKTEEDLIQNWQNIIFENNRDIDRLNDIPLTNSEMQQILDQVNRHKTAFNLNKFINGKTVCIKRDNEKDTLHYGKEVSLKIYNRNEIAAGKSRYQIARQPIFKKKSPLLQDRRGDFMLLINGMPVIHCELKKSSVDISHAYMQIQKYAHEGVFTGIFAMIQVFVAMNPDNAVYFANPGDSSKFNKDFYFHWADFNNEPINNWKDVAQNLLSIPMAHQLIGFYTVADNTDGILKVMRSYQYYAAASITSRVGKRDWNIKNQLGGFIWHTTGSGKTLTSFKSAQLISESNDADKVIFLVDRIELGTQSLLEFRGFADDYGNVNSTENTNILLSKLKSNNPNEVLIVTSIQKMSRIKEDVFFNLDDINIIQNKRIVIIIDEAHRDTFGEMLQNIKETFSNAMFFGFTGTPIHIENSKKQNTTLDIFGDELHRYSIADGIRDKNVLGFDPYMVQTYREKSIREAVALSETNCKSIEEVFTDPKKIEIYNYFMDRKKVPMAGRISKDGKYTKGIEDYLPKSQYDIDKHRSAVLSDISENIKQLSQSHKFHAIFATSSIHEAIEYYKLFKDKAFIKVTALFDPNIDFEDEFNLKKEDALCEILDDYNKLYGKEFSLATHHLFKKDVSYRLAHKAQYKYIEHNLDEQLDLLIVVDQMLTGFDSKWINTLYLDKVLEYERLIQAFSRTNRIFGGDKPFGVIRYYRKPFTMQENIKKAFELYSGDKTMGIFASKLDINLIKINEIYGNIERLFKSANIENFECLPEDLNERAQFAKLFKKLNEYIETAKIQGFIWKKLNYKINKKEIIVVINEKTFFTLVIRYKELLSKSGEQKDKIEDVPFEIDTHITEINTDRIDSEYMDSRFKKFIKSLQDGNETQNILDELHQSFASLPQEDQKFANILIQEIQNGVIIVDENKSLCDYILEYKRNIQESTINMVVLAFDLNESLLKELLNIKVTTSSINEYGRFSNLIESVNFEKAKQFFEEKEGKTLQPYKVNIKLDNFLRDFILNEGKIKLD